MLFYTEPSSSIDTPRAFSRHSEHAALGFLAIGHIAMVLPTPPRQVRVVAVLVWVLSKKADLGLCYIMSRRQRYDLGEFDVHTPAAAALLLASYLDDANVQEQVLLAIHSLDNKHRTVADSFLMHSLLVQHIVQSNNMGVVISLDEAICTYIRLWSLRPSSPAIERSLALLVWNRNSRRRFGVNLRREWSLTVSTFRTPRDLRSFEIRRRVFHTSCPLFCFHEHPPIVCLKLEFFQNQLVAPQLIKSWSAYQPEVWIFLKWLRYVVEVVVWDRPHVILNVDETSLSSVKHSGKGMISGRRHAKRDGRRRPRDAPDRHNTRTTYLAVVSDCAALQPLLPQVILAKYTQNAAPPAAVQATYAGCGYPFEFWHRSKGAVTPTIFKAWATRVRSVINTFNDSAWIVLLIDCATYHLSTDTIGHLRRLGYVIVMIPAKLTWLIQLLDVYVFGLLKRDIRLGEARHRTRSVDGRLEFADRIRLVTNSIRRHVINTDWSESFNKLGAGSDNRPQCSSLQEYLPVGDVPPALPSLAEFAELIARPVHTQATRRLHNMIMSGTLQLARSPIDTIPHHAAHVDLPLSLPASVAPTRAYMGAQAAHVTVNRFLVEDDLPTPRRLQGHSPALNVLLAPPVAP